MDTIILTPDMAMATEMAAVKTMATAMAMAAAMMTTTTASDFSKMGIVNNNLYDLVLLLAAKIAIPDLLEHQSTQSVAAIFSSHHY